jgi:hypothetical protein
LDRRLGGPQTWEVWTCGDENNLLPLPGIEFQFFIFYIKLKNKMIAELI